MNFTDSLYDDLHAIFEDVLPCAEKVSTGTQTSDDVTQQQLETKRQISSKTLNLAIETKQEELALNILTSYDFDISVLDYRDAWRRTSLHLAAMYGLSKVTTLLVKMNKKHIYSRDCEGNTPLHLAITTSPYVLVKETLRLQTVQVLVLADEQTLFIPNGYQKSPFYNVVNQALWEHRLSPDRTEESFVMLLMLITVSGRYQFSEKLTTSGKIVVLLADILKRNFFFAQ